MGKLVRATGKASEVAADTIGTMTRSGLSTDNGGIAFGVKARSPAALLKVTMADVANNPELPLDKPLIAGTSALAGDFFFQDA